MYKNIIGDGVGVGIAIPIFSPIIFRDRIFSPSSALSPFRPSNLLLISKSASLGTDPVGTCPAGANCHPYLQTSLNYIFLLTKSHSTFKSICVLYIY